MSPHLEHGTLIALWMPWMKIKDIIRIVKERCSATTKRTRPPR